VKISKAVPPSLPWVCNGAAVPSTWRPRKAPDGTSAPAWALGALGCYADARVF
jgi:hypothetical protein